MYESTYSILKGIHIPIEKGVEGKSRFPDIWFLSMICNQTWESLNILRNPKTLPHNKRHIKEAKIDHTS